MSRLGCLLKAWREARGLSVDAAAARAGIARATLFGWEAGAHRPRVPELTALLTALGVEAAGRETALSLLDAPRAVRCLRDEHEAAVERNSHLPAAGQLLWAMRHRRGLTLSQVAATIGVRPSTISRWERGESGVPEERRGALLDALAATPQERGALASSAILCFPTPEEPLCVEALGREFEATADRVHRGEERRPTDLEILALLARMAPLARRDAAARELDLSIRAHYGVWLSWEDRRAEARAAAERVLAAIQREGALPVERLLTAHRALHVRGLILGRGAGRRAPDRAVESILDWLPAGAHPIWESSLCRELAEHASCGGHMDAATTFAARAVAAAERTLDPEVIYCARVVQCDVWLRVGQPREALLLLEQTEPHPHPINGILDALRRVYALRDLGARADAAGWLERASARIEASGYTQFRRSVETVARQL